MEVYVSLVHINNVVIRGGLSSEAQYNATKTFSNLSSPVKATISTCQTCSTGINLHKECDVVVMIDPPPGRNTLLQNPAEHRLGQKEHQQIYILFTQHSFNRHIEHGIATKIGKPNDCGGKRLF